MEGPQGSSSSRCDGVAPWVPFSYTRNQTTTTTQETQKTAKNRYMSFSSGYMLKFHNLPIRQMLPYIPLLEIRHLPQGYRGAGCVFTRSHCGILLLRFSSGYQVLRSRAHAIKSHFLARCKCAVHLPVLADLLAFREVQ